MDCIKKFNDHLEAIYRNMKNVKMEEQIHIKSYLLEELLFPEFKKTKDCVVISNESILSLETKFEDIINYLGSTNYYEVYDTEILINSYLENEDFTKETLLYISIMVIKIWRYQLNFITNRKICFIISFDESRVTLRFHQVRGDGYEWLESDLNSYDEPVGYIIL